MKKNVILITVLLNFFSPFDLFSQPQETDYVGIQYNAQGANCDGSAKISSMIAPQPNYQYLWMDLQSNIIGTGDSIGGLCPGMYLGYVLDAYCNGYGAFFEIDTSGIVSSSHVHVYYDFFDYSTSYITATFSGYAPPFDCYITENPPSFPSIAEVLAFYPTSDTIFTSFQI